MPLRGSHRPETFRECRVEPNHKKLMALKDTSIKSAKSPFHSLYLTSSSFLVFFFLCCSPKIITKIKHDKYKIFPLIATNGIP